MRHYIRAQQDPIYNLALSAKHHDPVNMGCLY